MKRSLNEIQRICQKAAEGSGAPAGLDGDAAGGAVWLVARGLPALADLADDLARFPDPAAACRFERGVAEGDPVDASDKSGALVAPMLVDLLVARASAEGGPGRLRVAGLSAPLFLLPAAARYTGEGWRFRLDLDDGAGGRLAVDLTVDGDVEILGPAGSEIGNLFPDRRSWSLDAVCARRAHRLAAADSAGLAVLRDSAALAARQAVSLAEGVAPEPDAWSRLQALAAKVLVPATEQSHRRGAGALASDNE